MIFVLIGYALRVYALYHLNDKGYWKIKVPSKLIKHGPYKYIRHPMYLGTMLMFAGAAWIVTGEFWMTVLLSYMTLNFVIERIDREENILMNVFQNEYIEYMNKTKRLIPFIW